MTELSIATGTGVFDAIAAGPSEGRPVLLLHGFPQTALVWERQLGALAARGHRAVAPDQRGYSPGARPERPEDYRMDLLVDDVTAIADARPPRPRPHPDGRLHPAPGRSGHRPAHRRGPARTLAVHDRLARDARDRGAHARR
ncbi:alpha/beta fold hydrolase [Streptomyces sp. NPDC015684]|uniref:alpha/beta fold hydrolase n=1 Tax=Streptomyces sp. NPDC015684 TaxID=3364963 RepID=UPI0037025A05